MFGLTDKVLAYLGGGAAALLLAMLAYVSISKNATILALQQSIDAPVTGWRARLDACNVDRTTLRNNQAALKAALEKQNTVVEQLAQQSANTYYNGISDRAAAAEAVKAAQAKAAKLAGAQAGADMAKSADDLILEAVR